jgi:hypothetical protein
VERAFCRFLSLAFVELWWLAGSAEERSAVNPDSSASNKPISVKIRAVDPTDGAIALENGAAYSVLALQRPIALTGSTGDAVTIRITEDSERRNPHLKGGIFLMTNPNAAQDKQELIVVRRN